MKTTIYTAAPKGFAPTPVIRFFSPIDDPDACVMAQIYMRPGKIDPLSGDVVWVAVQTERVEKIKFVTPAAPAQPSSNVIKLEERKHEQVHHDSPDRS